MVERPVYLSSIGGDSNHWVSTGSSAIYADMWKSYSTYIHKSGIRVHQARSFKWHMNFLALPAGKSKGGICAGETSPGSTKWKQYSSDGLYVDVDTSMCAFSKAPVYKTSIGGTGHQWMTMGSSALYNVGRNKFRVYIFQKGVRVKAATDRRRHVVCWNVVIINLESIHTNKGKGYLHRREDWL